MKRAAFALILVASIGGCSQKSSTHAGTYVGRVEVPEATIDLLILTPRFAGKSREAVRDEVSGNVWTLTLDDDGTYRGGEDSGTWRYDDATQLIHMTIPASYKKGLMDELKRSGNVTQDVIADYEGKIVELRFRVEQDGSIWFESNDHFEDVGVDVASLGIDPQAVNMKFVFKRQ